MTHTAHDISNIARRICVNQRGAGKLLQIYRPYICPFEEILPHMPQNADVLDVGCGGGLFLGLAAEGGFLRRGLGFDANASVIELAQKLEITAGDVTFRHLDVEAPWPDGPFDVVTMIDVMHHIPPAAQDGIFELVTQRLKPGGAFIYKDINAADTLRSTANRLHDLALAQDWVHYLPTEKARSLAQQNGLTEEHYSKINRLWYGHDLHVFRKPS